MRGVSQDLLRIFTCGSVDDGKSTLIGRLLYETEQVYKDQLKDISNDRLSYGYTQTDQIDFARLLDGLEDEVAQGITIDVAYRYCSSSKRRFIVADTPGHEQYTRNMATGASTAELAILLVDARKGLLPQTSRHAYITAMMGIRHVVLAVNKMDLINYSEEIYQKIATDFKALSTRLNIPYPYIIPVSALKGQNVATFSSLMPWYEGLCLLDYLDSVNIVEDKNQKPFRFQVQWVNRSSQDFRGLSGTVSIGEIQVRDEVIISPSRQKTKIKGIRTFDGELLKAEAGRSITLLVEDELDIARGDILTSLDSLPLTSDQFRAYLLWMDNDPLYPGRTYWLKVGSKCVTATITKIRHKVNITTLEEQTTSELGLNDIGIVNVLTQQSISVDPYEFCRETGGFILIDKITHATVACGTIKYELRRSENIKWQNLSINKEVRSKQMLQKPFVMWFTGLSGSGKTTLANMMEQQLHLMGKYTYLLDADNIRHTLNKDLGFTVGDRIENIRRIGEISRLMMDAGLIVLVTCISPYKESRNNVRELFEEGEFIEVFVDAPLAICEKRDPKGLYKKVRANQIANFTGIDSIYEVPDTPEIHIDTQNKDPNMSIEIILKYLKNRL